MTNKEILVGVGTILFGVFAITTVLLIGPDLSAETLLKSLLGVLIAALVAVLVLPWWALQAMKRVERKHVREYHSADPKSEH